MPPVKRPPKPAKHVRTTRQHNRRMQQQRIRRAAARVAKTQLATRAKGKKTHKSVVPGSKIAAETRGLVSRATVFRYTTRKQRRLAQRLGKPEPQDPKECDLTPEQERNLQRFRNLTQW